MGFRGGHGNPSKPAEMLQAPPPTSPLFPSMMEGWRAGRVEGWMEKMAVEQLWDPPAAADESHQKNLSCLSAAGPELLCCPLQATTQLSSPYLSWRRDLLLFPPCLPRWMDGWMEKKAAEQLWVLAEQEQERDDKTHLQQYQQYQQVQSCSAAPCRPPIILAPPTRPSSPPPSSSSSLSSSFSSLSPCSPLARTGRPQTRLSAAILSFHSMVASILERQPLATFSGCGAAGTQLKWATHRKALMWNL